MSAPPVPPSGAPAAASAPAAAPAAAAAAAGPPTPKYVVPPSIKLPPDLPEHFNDVEIKYAKAVELLPVKGGRQSCVLLLTTQKLFVCDFDENIKHCIKITRIADVIYQSISSELLAVAVRYDEDSTPTSAASSAAAAALGRGASGASLASTKRLQYLLLNVPCHASDPANFLDTITALVGVLQRRDLNPRNIPNGVDLRRFAEDPTLELPPPPPPPPPPQEQPPPPPPPPPPQPPAPETPTEFGKPTHSPTTTSSTLIRHPSGLGKSTAAELSAKIEEAILPSDSSCSSSSGRSPAHLQGTLRRSESFVMPQFVQCPFCSTSAQARNKFCPQCGGKLPFNTHQRTAVPGKAPLLTRLSALRKQLNEIDPLQKVRVPDDEIKIPPDLKDTVIRQQKQSIAALRNYVEQQAVRTADQTYQLDALHAALVDELSSLSDTTLMLGESSEDDESNAAPPSIPRSKTLKYSRDQSVRITDPNTPQAAHAEADSIVEGQRRVIAELQAYIADITKGTYVESLQAKANELERTVTRLKRWAKRRRADERKKYRTMRSWADSQVRISYDLTKEDIRGDEDEEEEEEEEEEQVKVKAIPPEPPPTPPPPRPPSPPSPPPETLSTSPPPTSRGTGSGGSSELADDESSRADQPPLLGKVRWIQNGGRLSPLPAPLPPTLPWAHHLATPAAAPIPPIPPPPSEPKWIDSIGVPPTSTDTLSQPWASTPYLASNAPVPPCLESSPWGSRGWDRSRKLDTRPRQSREWSPQPPAASKPQGGRRYTSPSAPDASKLASPLPPKGPAFGMQQCPACW